MCDGGGGSHSQRQLCAAHKVGPPVVAVPVAGDDDHPLRQRVSLTVVRLLEHPP